MEKRNAAANDFDVAIPEKYKLTEPSAEEAERVIGEMLEKYEEQFSDFDSFRRKVDLLEENFEDQIKILFSAYML